MSTILIIVLAILAIATMLAISKNQKKHKLLTPLSDLKNIKKRAPLSPHEQKMYQELTAAVPGCIVLAQVAFSALITTNELKTRVRFDRKVADFVICTKDLTVIAIIELDDSSHRGKEKSDAERDSMLKNAGYNTLRYGKIPTKETIQTDIGAAIRGA